MNVRCPKCNRWLLEMIGGIATLRINCNSCKERWMVYLAENGVKIEVAEQLEVTPSNKILHNKNPSSVR